MKKKPTTIMVMLFMALILSTNLQAQMTLEYNLDLSSGTTITLPLYGTVNVTVDWGDGNSDSYTTTGDKSHTYVTGGTKIVSITGTLTQFGSGVTYSNANKLIKVTSFGSIGLTSLNGAFYGTSYLNEVPTILPSTITDLYNTFRETGQASITGLGSWDVSNVTYMRNLFLYASAFNQPLNTWNVSGVTNMRSMFNGATSFNQPLNNWDVSSVTVMRHMFRSSAFNQDIDNWDVSGVTDMASMFYEASNFNQPLNSWDVSSVTSMGWMFMYASSFNQPLSSWDVSSLTSMISMFNLAAAFNQDISNWNVSSITDMSSSFYEASSFNQSISDWDVSNVSNMANMFYGVTLSTANYNNMLIAWEALDLYNGVNFHGGNSFYSPGAASIARAAIITDDSWTITDGGVDNSVMALEFNTNLSAGTTITLPLYGTVNVTVNWGDGVSESFTTSGDKNHTYASEGSKIITIEGTLIQFGNSVAYNNAEKLVKVTSFGSLGITSLTGAFYGTTNLEEVPLTLPNTVTNISSMFFNAIGFNQDIGNWDVSGVSNMTSMFSGVTLSTGNYNSLLIAWEILELYNGVNFDGGNSKYSPGAASIARAAIIADDSWTITDGGESLPMVLEYNLDLSSGTTITLPLFGTVNVIVEWGDGSSETFITYGDINHTYSTGGVQTVEINGTLTQFGGSYTQNTEKLTKVISFGEIGLTSLYKAFYKTSNLMEVPATLPISITNLSEAFTETGMSMIIGLGNWDVGSVTDMSGMFSGAENFNQDIEGWDVGSVTDMSGMFSGAENFNQDIEGWDVSSVIDMKTMFQTALHFNQPINNWDVSNVTNMSYLFGDAQIFSQPLNNWDVSNVTNMMAMFAGAWNFNQDISNWDVSNVANMSWMFYATLNYNQPLNSWDVSNVTNMELMFVHATIFNQDISSWDVSNVINMEKMFSESTTFNQPLNSWNVSSVTSMRRMFLDANSFNQPLNNWDVSSVTNMYQMFFGATLSTVNYNSLLISWAVLDLYNGVTFHGGNSKYSAGAATSARAAIIADDLWTITDGGQETSIVWAATDDELSEWNIALSWQGGEVPTINDNVVIPASQYNPYIAPGNEGNCRNLTIDNGASLDLNSNFLDGAASLITNGTTQNNGIITAQRYTTAGQWHGISSPLSGATANSLYLNGNPDVWIKEHNETTNAYTYLSDLSTPLGDMKGFFTWIGGLTNQIFNIVGDLRSGEVGSNDNIVRSASGTDKGWNFIGNPFTSAIDWNASLGWTKTNIDGTIYVYNSPNWATWNGTTGTNGGSQYIAMGQGFFVNVNEGSSVGTLIMDDGVKVHNNVAYLKQTGATIDNLIRLQLSGNDYADETVILLNETATEGFDNNLDAHKLFSFNTDVPQIYSTANDYMAINGLPPSTTAVSIDVRGLGEMEMTISLTENSGFEDVFLEDNITGIQTNLIWENYSFTYSEDITNRFTIYFTTAGLQDKDNEVFKIHAFKNNVNVVIPKNQNAEIFVYNLIGQTIAHKTGTPGINKIAIDKMGYYVVKVVSNTSISAKKVFIK